MISGLISAEECAGCRQCCKFAYTDLMLTPLITPELAEEIRRRLPEQRFISREGTFLLRLEPEADDPGTYYCTLLDRKRGCIMGSRKPFECAIWPFAVTEKEGELAIALSPECPIAAKKPEAQIKRTAEQIADRAFEEAKKYPELIKPCPPGAKVIVEEHAES
ncbi:MAG: hypothetical protein IKP47_10180 [Ruminococcus sp.]|nr:hypothetical protein [Ruminococcus sp.]